jgi:glycerol-3-phosphate cytidylyltransferase
MNINSEFQKRIVYTSGTFDMMHANHLKMIQYARGLAGKSGCLIIGVSTDELVASYKVSAPIIPFEERIELIRALKYPDVVVPQYTLNHKELIKKLNISDFVIGDDWVGKYDYLKSLCQVYYFPYGRGVSTTILKKKIWENYENLRCQIDKKDNPQIDYFN